MVHRFSFHNKNFKYKKELITKHFLNVLIYAKEFKYLQFFKTIQLPIKTGVQFFIIQLKVLI